MIHAAVLGDISTEGTLLLGYLPKEADTGYEIRAINLGTMADIPASGSYYRLQFGTVKGTVFTPVTEIALNDGFKAGHRRWVLASPARVVPGALWGVRTVKTGLPSALTGLSVVLEYGILGARR